MASMPSLVQVRNLSVRFSSGGTVIDAVKGVSFTIGKGETVALVGESGSGKTVSALSILRLLPYPAASNPTRRDLLRRQGPAEGFRCRRCARSAASGSRSSSRSR